MVLSSHLPLLLSLLLLLLSTATSRPISSKSFQPLTASPTGYGPIHDNGRIYYHVCDPVRFADLGLKMAEFAYCNKNYSFYDRVNDLVGRMSLGEKIQQISDAAKGVERIGLPKYNWWSEILHGVSNVGHSPDYPDPGHATWFDDVVPGATSFPNVILSAASFNESLWTAIGQVVSNEARAMYNLGHTGLTFWSPNINLARDPRWGRILETPGEDPFVVGTYGVRFVRGLQDVEGYEVTEDLNTRPLKVSSCCKHYTAYDVDNWFGIDRYHYDARVAEQDMVESFNLPFEMCIKEGDASSIMCSYNRINGIPSCADTRLLSQTIRGEWGLHGYIVSDCDATKIIYQDHKWLHDTQEQAVAQVINAGLDLECGSFHETYGESVVRQGLVKEGVVDKALKNLYIVLMRLGFFDGMPKYQSLGKDDICTKANMDVAAEAARQGIVLLKNINHTLPLSKDKHKKLAIGGPHANATDVMLGNYAGIPCRIVSPLEAFEQEAEHVENITGCDLWCSDEEAREQMKQAAKRADATVLFMGISLEIEAESKDRIELVLPPNQVTFIEEVAEASESPITLVLLSAGGLDISFAKNNPKIGAIIWAGYPGQEGGRAIADVVYGRYNPGGRLPITWYENSYTEIIPLTSMPFRPVPELGYPGRTYKFYGGPTVYPFGYGLSYTKFKYTIKSHPSSLNVKLGQYQQFLPSSSHQNSTHSIANTADMACKEHIEFALEVANTGKMDGNEAVIVYAKQPSHVEGAPIKQVVAFKRVFVPAGGAKVVKFSIDACAGLSVVERSAYRVLASGKHTIMVGDASFPLHVKLSH